MKKPMRACSTMTNKELYKPKDPTHSHHRTRGGCVLQVRVRGSPRCTCWAAACSRRLVKVRTTLVSAQFPRGTLAGGLRPPAGCLSRPAFRQQDGWCEHRTNKRMATAPANNYVWRVVMFSVDLLSLCSFWWHKTLQTRAGLRSYAYCYATALRDFMN